MYFEHWTEELSVFIQGYPVRKLGAVFTPTWWGHVRCRRPGLAPELDRCIMYYQLTTYMGVFTLCIFCEEIPHDSEHLAMSCSHPGSPWLHRGIQEVCWIPRRLMFSFPLHLTRWGGLMLAGSQSALCSVFLVILDRKDSLTHVRLMGDLGAPLLVGISLLLEVHIKTE